MSLRQRKRENLMEKLKNEQSRLCGLVLTYDITENHSHGLNKNNTASKSGQLLNIVKVEND